MIIKRFVGPTAREAMRELRETLGDNALILSNRPIEDGVEIMAVAENEMSEIAGTEIPANPAMQSILNNAVKNAYQTTAKIQDDSFDDGHQVYLSSNNGGSSAVKHQIPVANATSATIPSSGGSSDKLSSLSQRAQAEVKKYQQPANQTQQNSVSQQPHIVSSRSPQPASKPATQNVATPPSEMKQLVREVKILRSMLEGQLADSFGQT